MQTGGLGNLLSERVIRHALGILNRRYLATASVHLDALPAPDPAKRYVLYAHVPFCERLCTYCSFNRFLYKEDRARAYFTDLRHEMRMAAELGYQFDSLYVGGGTPTILLDELATTIDLARELFPSLSEVSSETSPNHLTEELVATLDGRVQRLSVGIQSFDDRLLRQMDRYGKYGSGEEVFERVAAISHRFPSFNVDMIFNFPSQTEEVLARDIELVKATSANQTTFYPLMASPLRRRELAETVGDIDYDREARYYQLVCEALRPEFHPAHRLLPEQADRLADELPGLRRRLAGLGVRLSGGEGYLRRIHASTRGERIARLCREDQRSTAEHHDETEWRRLVAGVRWQKRAHRWHEDHRRRARTRRVSHRGLGQGGGAARSRRGLHAAGAPCARQWRHSPGDGGMGPAHGRYMGLPAYADL